MRSRILVAVFLLVGVLAAGAVATSGDRKSSPRQWAVVYLTEPTMIGSTIVQGPVLFTHGRADDAASPAQRCLFTRRRGRWKRLPRSIAFRRLAGLPANSPSRRGRMRRWGSAAS